MATVWRGMTVLVPEGSDATNAQVLFAAAMHDTRWGLGVHWSSSEDVSRRFGSSQGAPHPVPGMLQGPRGTQVEDTYYKGPRGTGVGVLFEAEVPEDSHDAYWSNIGVQIAVEEEISLKPGTPLVLVSLSWFDGHGWVRTPMNSLRATASVQRPTATQEVFVVDAPPVYLSTRAEAQRVPRRLHSPDPLLGARYATVTVRDYEGQVGNKGHITRNENGTLPTWMLANMPGVNGEVPGEHRNRLGPRWNEFKNDVATNGIQRPIFITVDHDDAPRISEGNHRRDAAVELGHESVPVEIKYFGHAEQQGSVADRAGVRPIAKIAALSLEVIVSVAEQAMERAGQAGRTITMPQGHRDDIEVQSEPLNAWARSIAGAWVQVYTNDYILRQEGYPIAMINGSSICVRPTTNEMTILHELAHYITHTNEGVGGHTVAFCRTAHDLYARHISPAAAETFWGIVGPSVEGRTSSFRPSHVHHWST